MSMLAYVLGLAGVQQKEFPYIYIPTEMLILIARQTSDTTIMYTFNTIIKNVNVKTDLATTNNTNNIIILQFLIIVHTHTHTQTHGV